MTIRLDIGEAVELMRNGHKMRRAGWNGDIGEAVALMRNGHKMRRAGWNGKGMWLALQVPDAHSKMTLPYVYMFTAQGDLVPWLCSQTDLLAADWEIAE